MTNKLSFEQAISQVAKAHGLGSEIERQEQIINKRFHNVPFWRWDLPVREHYQLYKSGQCNCFNCQIGWARKNNLEYPLFDYEQRYLSAIEKYRLVACIKSRASGISEVTLRYLEWLCLKDNKLAGTQIIIAASAAEEQTLSFMRRIRAHLEPILGTFASREKTIILNNVRMQTVPAHNLLQIRGQSSVSAIVLEESSFWHPNEESEILPIILPLRQKNPDIIISLISTPGRIGSLMHQIHMAPPDRTPFFKVYIPFTDVINKLYSLAEIEEAKRTNLAFEREYALQFGFGVPGSLFSPTDIQRCIDNARAYADSDPNYPHVVYGDNQGCSIGVDPAFGESRTAICGIQILRGVVNVFAQENYSRADEDFLINRVIELWRKTGNRRTNIYVDAAQGWFIKRLKREMITRYNIADQIDYELELDSLRKRATGTNWLGVNEERIGNLVLVVPVSFAKHGPRMLETLFSLIQKGSVAIDGKEFPSLIQDLQAARVKENIVNNDWSLDKDPSSGSRFDSLDSLRLCCYPLAVAK